MVLGCLGVGSFQRGPSSAAEPFPAIMVDGARVADQVPGVSEMRARRRGGPINIATIHDSGLVG